MPTRTFTTCFLTMHATSQVTTDACRSPMRMKLQQRYGLLSLAYMVGIYWLSSMDLRVMGGDPLIQLTLNLLHIPLYAGLAFCVLRAVSEGRSTEELRRGVSRLTIFVTGAY